MPNPLTKQLTIQGNRRYQTSPMVCNPAPLRRQSSICVCRQQAPAWIRPISDS